MIFIKISIKNEYSENFCQFLPVFWCMFFRAVGIKEIAKKKYNMDVLVDATSPDFVHTLFHDYGIVVLDVSEYPWEISTFWSVDIVVSYGGTDIHIISNLSNLRMIAHKFILMWFDVKYINFLDWRKMNDQSANDILNLAKRDVEMEKNVTQDLWQDEERQEETVYRDEALEKTLAVAEWQIKDINDKIYAIWTSVSSKDLRDIKSMEQELAKLRMWRNMDKIVDLLEKVLTKSLEIKQKYLSSQRENEKLLFKWSGITDIDVQSELNILDKAKNIWKIGKMRTFDDQYYCTFWFFWVQMKFLWRDIASKVMDTPNMLSVIFEFVEYFILFMLFICTFVLWIKWLQKWVDINAYLYVILIMFGIAWLVWYGLSFIKTKNIIGQTILLWLWLALFLSIYFAIKYFFVL